MNRAIFTRRSRRRCFLGGMFLIATSLTINVNAEETPEVIRVEEDWELVVNQPEPALFSPQITLFVSPTSSETDYFQLQMNYAADDEFSGGGFHVAAVKNEQIYDEARSVTRIPLRTDGDRIRWTSVMAAFDDRFYFAVRDGHSDDWGAFGGPQYLVEMTSGSVKNLDGYSYQKSVDNIDIGFGANRVSSLKLLRVRLYYKSGGHTTIQVHDSAE